MAVEINFADLGAIHNLVGEEEGKNARRRFRLDEIEASGGRAVFIIPKDVFAVSHSFWSGLFSDTITKYGRVGFHVRYKFRAPSMIQRSAALYALYMERKLAREKKKADESARRFNPASLADTLKASIQRAICGKFRKTG